MLTRPSAQVHARERATRHRARTPPVGASGAAVRGTLLRTLIGQRAVTASNRFPFNNFKHF